MCLKRYEVPAMIINYIVAYYSDLYTFVLTDKFRTEPIKINVGIFQGDTLSCTLFLLAFNPILEFLKTEISHGAPIDPKTDGSSVIIGLAFADDLTLICRHLTTLQRILNIVDSNLRKVGLILKPTKCSTLSLSSGTTTNHQFRLGKKVLETIESSSFKFLGTTIFPRYQKRNAAHLLLEKLETMLNQVDSAKIRGAYKVQIYDRYITQCIRFCVTVYDTTSATASQMESICTRFIKKWIGGRSFHSMNVDFLYHPDGLGLKSITQICQESRAGLIVDCLMSEDPGAKEAARTTDPVLANEIRELIAEDQGVVAKTSVINAIRKRIGKDILTTRNEKISSLLEQGQWKKIL
jgi:hypothetical protein